ncbi:MAG: GntR family transcriptional regulator [Xanthobacteraceae bacterium]|nr:GntR family transcriptional regulator [Xanthobacteraceae bacterium]
MTSHLRNSGSHIALSPRVEPKLTLADELRIRLADDIVRGFLPLGATLDESQTARRFQVSRTPVREAFRELAASGLVDAKPHRSTLVARPDSERLNAMFETMAELEAVCAGLAAQRMTVAERQSLQEIHEQLRVLSFAGNPEQFHEINEQFHNAIYIGTHNNYLGELTIATRKRVQPFRRAQFRNLGRLHKSQAEHHHVVEAILREDRAAASAAMHAHIDLVHNEYESYAGSTLEGEMAGRLRTG